MTVETIKQYCLSKHKAYEDLPFGDVPICYKLNGKIFAQLYPYEHDYKITLKCTAEAGMFYRSAYPEKVIRGYHCPPVQQPYWNTIYLEDFPEDELFNMIDLAYETVFSSFSKKVQKMLMEEESKEMIKLISNEKGKENIAREILAQLPEWFGLPDSTKEYISCSKKMPFWAYFEGEVPVGFIALKETSKFTVEVYVMGVLKEYHRNGIGRKLMEAFLQYAKEKGYEYAQVKTVQKGRYREYDITNGFYEKLGFRELECFPTLWDEWNPCQVYVKYIGER